jgi:hypothetical protein
MHNYELAVTSSCTTNTPAYINTAAVPSGVKPTRCSRDHCAVWQSASSAHCIDQCTWKYR